MFTVRFYSFSKRTNSTKTVTGASEDYSCVLKENTDIINPTIIINGGANFNPKFLNYCWISQFNRYYFVNTWRYVIGSWECDCEVDVLATFKPVLGTKEKYVLRSAYKYNRNLVDNLYPALSWQPNYYIDTESFNFYTSIEDGTFIVGIVNRMPENFGAVTYYALSALQIQNLIKDMLPTASETWTQGFTQMTDTLYRAIYSPFDYIKSCKWFPLDIRGTGNTEPLFFGNYESLVEGRPIRDNTLFWYDTYKNLELPTSWLSLDAKYRTQPYAHIYLYANPWGVIELNPLDFTDSRIIHIVMQLDYINGDAILKIYKTVGTTNYFIVQKVAKLGIDINLSQSSVDFNNLLSSSVGAGVGLTTLASATGAPGVIAGAITTGASVVNAILSTNPTIGSSVGLTTNSIKGLGTGEIMLIYTSTYFAEEDNAEYGKPLCENTVLSTIPGYIICNDGDIEIAGAMKQELDKVSEFLTGGFFYE